MLKFKQIVIEFHDPFIKYRYDILEKLSETHFLVHLHGNNHVSVNYQKKLEGFIGIPDVFECTYIRKDDLNLQLNKNSFPIDLDQPNAKWKPDIKLSGFPYTQN